jgi:hypothetical protein
MGLISGILGGIGSSEAGHTIQTAGNNAATAVNNATAAGQAGVTSALGTNASNVNAAGSAAISGVNTATGNANSTISNYLGATNANINPYLQSGAQGNTEAQQLAANNPQFNPQSVSQYMNSPAEQFQLQQGQQAIGNTAASQGLASSGAAAKELTQYGQQLGSTYYQQAFNNAQSQFQTNQAATTQDIQNLLQSGESGTAQYNQTMENAGNQQAANTLGAGYYAGNTNTALAQFNAGQNLQGNEYNAGLGLQGATTAGGFSLTGAEGAAAGQQGLMNGLGSIL